MSDFNVTSPSPLNDDDRTVAILTHISGLVAVFLGGFAFLGPLVFYFITMGRSPELRAHVLESLNFSFTVTIAVYALFASMFLVITIPFAFIGLILIFLGYLVFSVLAAIDASNARLRRYPLTWRIVTK
ncbi:DUF4870 domain-containing protein [Stomatohabitans albus]|uniref:DUF4870 domain-containing protein n=1 Tax=Stomatohabitans albus TaxID=3110766 RepID=UPI00300CEB8C